MLSMVFTLIYRTPQIQVIVWTIYKMISASHVIDIIAEQTSI